MNKIISIIGLGSLGVACRSEPTPIVRNPPAIPRPETYNPPPDTGESTKLPSWDEVTPPTASAKPELILTPSGCYKNWVDANVEPQDRYEEKGSTALGSLIECPERAKTLSKQPTKKTDTTPNHQ